MQKMQLLMVKKEEDNLIVEINSSDKQELQWDAKGNNRVVQNLRNMLSTFKYEVAYDRTMGLSGAFIDKPLDQAIATVTTEIIELVSERELSAIVKEIQFTGIDDDGMMQFKVVIDIE
jgi:uncharacterized protein